MSNTIKIIIIGFLAGFGGTYAGYQYIIKPALDDAKNEYQYTNANLTGNAPQQYSNGNTYTANPADPSVDFSGAAAKATQSVVYINSISQGVNYNYWDWFFGEGSSRQTQVSSG